MTPHTSPFDARVKSYDPSRMILLKEFDIPQLNRRRLVRIYLPEDYATSSKRYPVIYMHDGQNVFEPELCISGMSWQAGEQLDHMQANGETDGVIIVAVDNSPLHNGFGRMNEYSPWPCELDSGLDGWNDFKLTLGGEGEAYGAFIADTLKPYIDQHYRTRKEREYTTVAGSSMGGLISLYIALRYQQSFANAGVFSPAFWFADKPIENFIQQTAVLLPLNIYMDIGTEETSDHSIAAFPSVYFNGAKRIHQLLQDKSNMLSCSLTVEQDAVHSESAWAQRFPDMVRQLSAR
ncbi:alpha/beta hydrolase [Photobacterium alginatilyticum]|uniref:Alpha/beta hydrolase n=1 Tax=Photobacterium alginatilyticum TaxID=1775171 RepID=A0ABW9YMQ1_9GAMM|nr:alpha/beta hydrolase-fold protein [Photobacterium alginatilyticum]NBI55010.1 alpha/beta hydrolase [Photobacterium alginatilyticum]